MNFEKPGYGNRFDGNHEPRPVEGEEVPGADYFNSSSGGFANDKFYSQATNYAEKMDREKLEQLETLRQLYAAPFPVKQLNVETLAGAEYSKEKEQEDRGYLEAWRSYHEGKNKWLADELRVQKDERRKLAQTYDERQVIDDWYFAETQRLFVEQQSTFTQYMERLNQINQGVYRYRTSAFTGSAYSGTSQGSPFGERVEPNSNIQEETVTPEERPAPAIDIEALLAAARKEAEEREAAQQERIRKLKEKEEREAREHQERMRQRQERHDRVMNILSEIKNKMLRSLAGLTQATPADEWFYKKCQELQDGYSSPDQLDEFYTGVEKAMFEYEEMKAAETFQEPPHREAENVNERESTIDASQAELLATFGLTSAEYDVVMSDKGVDISPELLRSLVLRIMKVENPHDTEAVKKSFRRLAMDWHPDRSSDKYKLFNAQKFAVLNAFYNNIYRPRFNI